MHPSTRLLRISHAATLATCALAQAPLPTEDPPVTDLHPMLRATIEAGPYEPQWASLTKHPLPTWFQRDKIGLSAHWGPYAVPGWTPRKDTPYGVAYAEWYWQWMKSNEAVKEHHQKTYGGVAYDAFFDGTKNLVTGEVEGFFARDFDADRWMQTFADAGVRYFFITSKHHDGFCLWDSRYTDRNAAKLGPKRDLLRELTDAARRRGIRIGFYYSFYEWFHPVYRGEGDLAAYKGLKALGDEDQDGVAGEYVDDFMVPQLKELIDNYHPDYLCFDGEWEHGYPYWRARQIVAYYYNQAAARGQQVVVNDRYGQKKEGVSDTRGVYGDFYHVEYHANIDRAKPWAMWRGFGNSYGYNQNEHPDNILSVRDTLRMVVDVVAENGNVEFNLGPKADGTLAAFERERLAAMGEWLKVHGDAIYGTTKSPVGTLPDGRLTHKAAERTLYFHVYDWPDDGVLELPGIANRVTRAWVLSDPTQEVTASDPEPGLIRIRAPRAAPHPHVSVIALQYEGALEAAPYVKTIRPDDAGRFDLPATAATIHGERLVLEDHTQALGVWYEPSDYPEWTIEVDAPGRYAVTVEIACLPAEAGSAFRLVLDGEATGDPVTVPSTGSWTDFETIQAGVAGLPLGRHTLRVQSQKEQGPLMNLRRVRLQPAR